MQIAYIDPSEIAILRAMDAPAGSILFQSTSGTDHAPRLIGTSANPADPEQDLKRYVNLASVNDGGFLLYDAGISYAAVAVLGWRVEVDPATARHPGAATPAIGDVLLQGGATFLLVRNDYGEMQWLDLGNFEIARPSLPDATSAAFSKWRLVKQVSGREEPVVVFGHERVRL